MRRNLTVISLTIAILFCSAGSVAANTDYDYEAPAATSATYSYTSPAATTSNLYLPYYYTVQPGDSFAGIAKAVGTSEEKIKIFNHISLRSDLIAGKDIIICLATPAWTSVYVAKKGDTPAAIAQEKAIPVEAVLAMNRLNDRDYALETGRVMLMPGPEDYKIEDEPLPPPAEGMEALVQLALTFEGYPYMSPSDPPKSFVCSTLTQYVFKQFGVALPGTAKAQSLVGTRIEKSQIQRGDLLFFGIYGSEAVGHVGISLGDIDGDGQIEFIHAANSDKGVIIDDLPNSKGYYFSNYKWATRISL